MEREILLIILIIICTYSLALLFMHGFPPENRLGRIIRDAENDWDARFGNMIIVDKKKRKRKKK